MCTSIQAQFRYLLFCTNTQKASFGQPVYIRVFKFFTVLKQKGHIHKPIPSSKKISTFSSYKGTFEAITYNNWCRRDHE